MKHLLKVTIVLATILAAISCEKKIDVPEEPLLDVTANNISGIWKVAEWNGHSLEEGTYVYIEFTRRDQTFTIYQNTDSFIARKITGRFNITEDEEFGAIIRGQYDYGNGDWRHRYIVRELKKSTMTWIAKDDVDDITVYERCDEIPADILAQTHHNEE